MERVDIAGSLFALAVSIGTALVMTDDSQGWDWTDFVPNWPQYIASLGLAITFGLFVIVSRKSTSHTATGHFQIVFIHTVSALILSIAAALGLEVTTNYSSWLGYFVEFDGHTIWKAGCVVAIGIVYKLAVILTCRFSETHTFALAVHLGIVFGASVSRFYPLIESVFNDTSQLVHYAKSFPRHTAGVCLVIVGLLYWFVRVLMLRFMFARKQSLNPVPQSDAALKMEKYQVLVQ